MSTSFSATCSRLSQYLKHNGGGSLADLHISPQPPVETLDLFPCPSSETDRSSSSSSSSSKPAGKSQLTILYGGKVLTFDDFPANKAGDLMSMAGGGGAMAGGLPIARRRSLHLFLQKRKDRINSKAPYQLNGSSSSKDDDVSSVSEKPWLGLDLNAVPT